MPRREYQDFSNFAHFGTRAFWEEIEATPCLAGEVMLQRLVFTFGLMHPSEKCLSRVAASIMTAQYGPCAGALVTDSDMDRCFEWVKARPCPPCFVPTCVRGHNRDSSILDDPHLRSRSQPREQYIR
jgi:hypothetical protein